MKSNIIWFLFSWLTSDRNLIWISDRDSLSVMPLITPSRSNWDSLSQLMRDPEMRQHAHASDSPHSSSIPPSVFAASDRTYAATPRQNAIFPHTLPRQTCCLYSPRCCFLAAAPLSVFSDVFASALVGLSKDMFVFLRHRSNTGQVPREPLQPYGRGPPTSCRLDRGLDHPRQEVLHRPQH